MRTHNNTYYLYHSKSHYIWLMSEEEVAAESEPTEPTEPTDPLQFLSHVKSKLKRHLKVNESEEQLRCDLGHIIREIRALITVNAEILNAIASRCVVCKDPSDDNYIIARRLGFKEIKSSLMSGRVELYAFIDSDDRKFDVWPLTNLPSCLKDTISANYNEDTRLDVIDMNGYFQKVLMVASDDALGFILPKLKDHLQTAQVCLGKIHEWAMHPTNDLSFMNLDFQDVLKIPSHVSSGACRCCGGLFTSDTMGWPCTEKNCGKRIVIKSFEKNLSFDLSSESEKDRLLKHIRSITEL